MKILLGFLSLLLVSSISAQGPRGGEHPKIGTYSGQVVNGVTKNVLPYTKIFLLSARDSSLLAVGLSDGAGNFLIE